MTTTARRSIGQVVRRLRIERGTTQEALASQAGVTTATLSRIERGVTNPAWSTVEAISRALGIATHELAQAVEHEHPATARGAGGDA